jgi:hypothetical protein
MNVTQTPFEADRDARGGPHHAGRGSPDREPQRNRVYCLASIAVALAEAVEIGIVSDAEAFVALKAEFRRHQDPKSRHGCCESVGKEDGSGSR